jgi:DNA-binding GntR family transcriptional regulator
MKMIKLKNNLLLRDQIYEYLREQINIKKLEPGSYIDIKRLSEQLSVSRTPLRDALLQLQAEKFVTIMPQRGVMINELSLEDVENIYEILGGLESRVVISVFNKIGKAEIEQMRLINSGMGQAGSIIQYYDLNLKFHNIFLNLSENAELLKQVKILKQRLYDFYKVNYGEAYKKNNYNEHKEFVKIIESGDSIASADFLRDVHWVFRQPDITMKHIKFG